jgi:hypothetical protein
MEPLSSSRPFGFNQHFGVNVLKLKEFQKLTGKNCLVAEFIKGSHPAITVNFKT